MKKIATALIALLAVSQASFAERNYDLRDSDTYYGEHANPSVKRIGQSDVGSTHALEAPFTVDQDVSAARESRRLDEKNEGPVSR